VPADITQTPEFASALDKAVAAALEKALAGVKAFGAMPESPNSAAEMMNNLAMALQEINGQGSNKQVVDPAVMRQRAESWNRCVQLILASQERAEKLIARGDERAARDARPRYRVLHPCYLGDRIIQPYRVGRKQEAIPQEITYSHPPNMSLLPLNDVAKEIFAEFRASIGNMVKVASATDQLASITAGGLIVYGKSINHRTLGSGDTIDADDLSYADDDRPSNDGLEIIDNKDPRNKDRRVLGTIAEAARMPSDLAPVRA
jgi:hypothetical protein